MLFQVFRDNKCLMSTEYEECIPSIEQIKSMKAAGYKVLLDGKTYKITKTNNKNNKGDIENE